MWTSIAFLTKLDIKDCTQSLEVPHADCACYTKYMMKLPIEGHPDERAASEWSEDEYVS